MLKSGLVQFFEDFCEPGTGPMVQFRQMSEPWTRPCYDFEDIVLRSDEYLNSRSEKLR